MRTFKSYCLYREWGDDNSINGEYWINDDGDILHADGDTGDMNHEGHVIDTLQSQITSLLDHNYEHDWEKFKEKAAEAAFE